MSTVATQGEGTLVPGFVAPRWWERWGDRLNPLVVKEVRQGVRSRIFWVCFGLMLLACFVISVTAFLSTRDEGLSSQGQGFFFAFFICLSVVHFFIIPYSAYRSLAREREDETWVLLVLTGLGPRKILRGKMASYLVQAGLYASAVGPFLLFSYYLNGIDLPTILVVLVLGGAWLCFVTVVAVCAATLADGRLGRALVHFLLLGALGMSFIYALVAAFYLSEEGYRSATRDHGFYVFVGCALWVMLSNAWLLFETAAARLSLLTENYSLGPRLALVLQTLISALLMLGLGLALNPSHNIALGASIGGCLYLTLTGLFIASDHDGQAKALRVRTRPWSLMRPGALRGFRLVVLLLLVWGAACVLFYLLQQSRSSAEPQLLELLGVLAAPVYAILYLGLPLLVGRMPRSHWLASPVVVRLLFFMLLGLVGLVSPLMALLFDQSADEPTFNLLNPFVGLSNFARFADSSDQVTWEVGLGLLSSLALVALLVAFATDRCLVERERRAHAA